MAKTYYPTQTTTNTHHHPPAALPLPSRSSGWPESWSYSWPGGRESAGCRCRPGRVRSAGSRRATRRRWNCRPCCLWEREIDTMVSIQTIQSTHKHNCNKCPAKMRPIVITYETHYTNHTIKHRSKHSPTCRALSRPIKSSLFSFSVSSSCSSAASCTLKWFENPFRESLLTRPRESFSCRASLPRR